MDQSLTEQRRRDGRLIWMLCSAIAGLVMGAALMWWGVFSYYDRGLTETIQRQNVQLSQAGAQLNELRAERGLLEGKLAVERSTRQGLERTLGTVQQELGAARDQIAFFYELMPPGPEGSISIRGFDIQRQGDLLHFRVLLMRHGAGDQPFEGMLQFQATGWLDGKEVKLTLEPARSRESASPDAPPISSDAGPGVRNSDAAPSGSILALRFDQFQRSSGLLHIPEGIELETVTLNVLEGDTLRVSRTVEIPVQAPVH